MWIHALILHSSKPNHKTWIKRPHRHLSSFIIHHHPIPLGKKKKKQTLLEGNGIFVISSLNIFGDTTVGTIGPNHHIDFQAFLHAFSGITLDIAPEKSGKSRYCYRDFCHTTVIIAIFGLKVYIILYNMYIPIKMTIVISNKISLCFDSIVYCDRRYLY